MNSVVEFAQIMLIEFTPTSYEFRPNPPNRPRGTVVWVACISNQLTNTLGRTTRLQVSGQLPFTCEDGLHCSDWLLENCACKFISVSDVTLCLCVNPDLKSCFMGHLVSATQVSGCLHVCGRILLFTERSTNAFLHCMCAFCMMVFI